MLIEKEQVEQSKSESWGVCRKLAESFASTEKTQDILMQDADESVRSTLAKNPVLVEKLQLLLAKDKNIWLRCDLASNTALTERLQFILSNDECIWVRSVLARNSTLTGKIQVVLGKDADQRVRYTLALNPSLTEGGQEMLAKDGAINVRVYLTQNPALKLKAAILLYYDEDERVVQNFKRNNKKLYEQIASLEKEVLLVANMSFVGLASEIQQRSVTKKLVGQAVSNL